MKNKPLMADWLDLTINKFLWAGKQYIPYKSEYSCHALMRARAKTAKTMRNSSYPELFPSIEQARDFLIPLGCNLGSFSEFDEFEKGQTRQYARALWLTWAAMIAREEGL